MGKTSSRTSIRPVCFCFAAAALACSAAGDGAKPDILVAAEPEDRSRTTELESALSPDEAGPMAALPAPKEDPALSSPYPLAPTEDANSAERPKIDFLFIVDNSRSMRDEQSNLAASLPSLVRAVEQRSDIRDIQIMVVDTEGGDDDGAAGNVCEGVLGAGKRRSSEGQECGIEGEQRFLAQGQSELEQTFSCVAQRGSDGDSREKIMAAMVAASGPLLNAVGGCNAGFLRKDALLVVTVISDEDDDRSGGEPEDWRRSLLAAKADRPDRVVLLGLLGDNNLPDGLAGGPCKALDADGAPRLQRFVEGFEFNAMGSVCATDYTPFFADAAELIGRACDGLASSTAP